jgi:hypothetical protein
MWTARSAVLAGVAVIAIAASAGLALAKDPAVHHLVVQLPDGAVAQVQYTGNVAPRISFATNPFAADFNGPASPDVASPIVGLDRISAQMDAEMNALIQQADSLPMPVIVPDKALSVDLANAPRGATRYTFESMAAGNGDYCTRSMRVISRGAGESPKVVEHSSGDCRAFGQATFGADPHGWHSRTPRGPIEVNARPRQNLGQPGLVEAAYHPVN